MSSGAYNSSIDYLCLGEPTSSEVMCDDYRRVPIKST